MAVPIESKYRTSVARLDIGNQYVHVYKPIHNLPHLFRRQLHQSPCRAKVIAVAAVSRNPVIKHLQLPEARAYPEIQNKGLERMPRDGGFHPFKGRVSKHFGESVGTSLYSLCGRSRSA